MTGRIGFADLGGGSGTEGKGALNNSPDGTGATEVEVAGADGVGAAVLVDGPTEVGVGRNIPPIKMPKNRRPRLPRITPAITFFPDSGFRKGSGGTSPAASNLSLIHI